MRRIYVAVLLFVCFRASKSAETSCCSNGAAVFNRSTCISPQGQTQKINLECEAGSYAVNKALDPTDYYTIEGENLIFNYSNSEIKPGGYCIGEKNRNGTVYEIAIICAVNESKERPGFILRGALALISVFFLCITLYVYKIIPHLRETQDKVTIVCLICLALAFTVLGLAQTAIFPDVQTFACSLQAFSIYFFTMAYFSWLNVVTANVLKSVVFPQWKIKEKTWYLLNHLYGWSIPITLTIILMCVQHSEIDLHPGIGQQSCWILEHVQWAYIYLPMSIMISINLILFIIVAAVLFKFSADTISSSRKKALKYKCQLYFKLFILSGLTWIFEVLSYIFKEWKNYWLITDIINASHGIIVFLILVIFRKRIRRELAGKKICCFTIPQDWKKIDNTEDCLHSEEETRHENIPIRT